MIDQFSVSVVTALVVVVSGVLFVFETLLRRQERSGQLWALGYLAAILTTLLYLVWAWQPDIWWAVALGNASFVIGTGSMWLGCRQFNDRSVIVSGVLVAAAAAAAGVAAALPGADGGDWAGAAWMFIALALGAGAACVECFRGALGATGTAVALGLVFGLQAAYYTARTVVFFAAGPESDLFQTWFGTLMTSCLTVVLTITAVVCTCLLRASRASLRGTAPLAAGAVDGIRSEAGFSAALAAICDKARARQQLVAVTVLHLEELDYIAAAFGLDVQEELLLTWRSSVLRSAPTLSATGEIGPGELAVVSIVLAPADARREGMRLYRSLFEDLSDVTGGVLPAIGVGIALSDGAGYDPDRLVRHARAAATRAASGLASAVLLSEPV
ncbi:hypothetical protein ACFQRL_08600 [Microbacterium fluvii]|uniref:GGDEF domain-containing protein n=1 Tax=Microbacterium fluvii TaxID=415215 RepID=A0ABW2HG76_9MICO|nr:hypothetical protein [Microbacterium fluvii]MCU4672646.1 hypothetical protein [Microbacterium fluvii]